jgi:hypothetical protein
VIWKRRAASSDVEFWPRITVRSTPVPPRTNRGVPIDADFAGEATAATARRHRKYPPAKPRALPLVAPQRGLIIFIGIRSHRSMARIPHPPSYLGHSFAKGERGKRGEPGEGAWPKFPQDKARKSTLQELSNSSCLPGRVGGTPSEISQSVWTSVFWAVDGGALEVRTVLRFSMARQMENSSFRSKEKPGTASIVSV